MSHQCVIALVVLAITAMTGAVSTASADPMRSAPLDRRSALAALQPAAQASLADRAEALRGALASRSSLAPGSMSAEPRRVGFDGDGCDPDTYKARKLRAIGGKADDQFGWSVAINDDTAVIGAPNRETSPGVFAGSAFVFVLRDGGWIQQAEIVASAGQDLAAFGYAVGVNGDTIVVGAPFRTSGGKPNAGAAYVFVRRGTTWTQQGSALLASDIAANDNFGFAVAINRDTIVVGAPGRTVSAKDDAGQVYVFERKWTSWSEQAKLTAGSLAQPGDTFGFAVAITDAPPKKAVVIGAPARGQQSSSLAGRAHVFRGTGSGWTRESTLVPSDGVSGDAFGFSVGVSNNTAVVGSPGHDPGGKPLAGQAYVYKLTSSWTLQSKLVPSDAAAGDNFGAAVDVSRDTIVAGAPSKETSAGIFAGQAYVYDRKAQGWRQQAILNASEPGLDQFFGFAAAADGNTLVVGAPFHAPGVGPAAGPAYVFTPVYRWWWWCGWD